MDNENKELNVEEKTEVKAEKISIDEENLPEKKNKIKMNFLYKTAFVLFCIAFCLLIAAMVICLAEDSDAHNSFFAILFSTISAGLAFLGIIFACVSKEKKQGKRQRKKHRYEQSAKGQTFWIKK